MNRYRLLLAAVALLGAGAANAATAPAKAPPKGVKCGDSYIAVGQVCHKTPPPAAKGVECGDSYIAAGQVCHKPTTAAPAKTAMTAPAKPAMAPAKPAMAKPAMAKPAPAAKGKKCGASYIAATAVCTKK